MDSLNTPSCSNSSLFFLALTVVKIYTLLVPFLTRRYLQFWIGRVLVSGRVPRRGTGTVGTNDHDLLSLPHLPGSPVMFHCPGGCLCWSEQQSTSVRILYLQNEGLEVITIWLN